jgi:Tfp pilus assembly protein PilF
LGGGPGTTRPGRPDPGGVRPLPGERPGIGGNRPGIGGNRPGIDRPGRPGGGRPGIGDGIGNRPRPGTRPWWPDTDDNRSGRPGIGGTRPWRPGFPYNRPGRPGIDNHPGRPGFPSTRPNRPVFGNNFNINNSWNQANWNQNNVTNIYNQVNNQYINNNVFRQNNFFPGYGRNWGYGGGWGFGGGWTGSPRWGFNAGYYGGFDPYLYGYGYNPDWGNWCSSWRSYGVPAAYGGWYSGCWNSVPWYAPIVSGLTSWSLNTLAYNIGYSTYTNPYYVQPVVGVASAPVNYSQPLVINLSVDPQTTVTTASPDPTPTAAPTTAAAPPPVDPKNQVAYDQFDQARAAFREGNYVTAQTLIDQVLTTKPGDAPAHEFRALTLFAQGKYKEAAATLNALLAVAPGWDWTTMISLYGDSKAYEAQLRNLELYRDQSPRAAEARFLLAYHYLVCGHTDNARKELERLVEIEPNDVVASRLLAGLKAQTAAQTAEAASPPEAAAPTEVAQAQPAGEAGAPAVEQPVEEEAAIPIDLVGSWKASRTDGTSFHLELMEDGKFEWSFTPAGGSAQSLNGEFGLDNDRLVLQGAEESQGAMVAKVTPETGDRFKFAMVGGPPNDPGLTFERMR